MTCIGPVSMNESLLLPISNEVYGKVMFYTCLSFCPQGEGVTMTETPLDRDLPDRDPLDRDPQTEITLYREPPLQ